MKQEIGWDYLMVVGILFFAPLIMYVLEKAKIVINFFLLRPVKIERPSDEIVAITYQSKKKACILFALLGLILILLALYEKSKMSNSFWVFLP